MNYVSGVPSACCWCRSGMLDTVWERYERPEEVVVGKVVCRRCHQASLYSRRLTFYEQTQLARDELWRRESAAELSR